MKLAQRGGQHDFSSVPDAGGRSLRGGAVCLRTETS